MFIFMLEMQLQYRILATGGERDPRYNMRQLLIGQHLFQAKKKQQDTESLNIDPGKQNIIHDNATDQ